MFTLEEIVPWGRSFDEYRRMFALGSRELSQRILGCGDGPASFNAVATRRGTKVVSCDPIYRFEPEAIRKRIESTRETILEQTRRNSADFVWTSIRSVEELRDTRMTAMNEFLEDFPLGRQEGRYIEAELPALPWPDDSFDLALCSHLLFLYSAQLGFEFHERSVFELCRIGREVRIFPLLTLGGERSPYLDHVIDALERSGLSASIQRVPYEFQRNGNEMMVIGQRTGRNG